MGKRRMKVERTYKSASAKRVDLQGKPAWQKVVAFFGGEEIFPTDVALLTGSDMPYSVRVLQKLERDGWAKKTGGLRTPYLIYKRRQTPKQG